MNLVFFKFRDSLLVSKHRFRIRFSDERESVHRQCSAPSSYLYVNIFDFLSRPPQKLKRTCSTNQNERERKRERERERDASEGVCADCTAHSLVICQYFRFFKQASSKTEMIVLHSTHVSQTIDVLHKTKQERGGERLQKGCAQIVQCTL